MPASSAKSSDSFLLSLGLAICAVAGLSLYLVIERAHGAFVAAAFVHAALYLLVVWRVCRGQSGSRDLVIILAVAVLLRMIAFPAPQSLTTDAFRYVWDGRIQLAGFNPYLWIPASEELAHLRDAVIYPNIYLKEIAVTVYPPVAEMLFALGVLISDSIMGVKIVMTAFEAVTVWAVMAWLRADNQPRERVVIYAWHPLPLWEFTGQAHIDSAAIGLMLLAVVLAVRRAQFLSGMMFAVAVCTKFFPAVLMPALWRRWDWRMPVAFVSGVALLYLPYWLSAGSGVIGFARELAEREGYTAGYGFHVIWLLRDYRIADPPVTFYLALALCVIGGLAAFAFFVRGREEIRPVYLVALAGTFIWLTSPHHVWYFGWVIPLLCRRLSLAALAMSLLCILRYAPPAPPWITPSSVYLLTFALPLAILASEILFDHWRQRREALHGLAAPR